MRYPELFSLSKLRIKNDHSQHWNLIRPVGQMGLASNTDKKPHRNALIKVCFEASEQELVTLYLSIRELM